MWSFSILEATYSRFRSWGKASVSSAVSCAQLLGKGGQDVMGNKAEGMEAKWLHKKWPPQDGQGASGGEGERLEESIMPHCSPKSVQLT